MVVTRHINVIGAALRGLERRSRLQPRRCHDPHTATGAARRVEFHPGPDGRWPRQFDLVVDRMKLLVRAPKRRRAMGAGRHPRLDPLIGITVQTAAAAAMPLVPLLPVPLVVV